MMTLCFSRHQYAELVFDQKVSTWIACHRHAFESFGGFTQRVVLDYVPRHIIRRSSWRGYVRGWMSMEWLIFPSI